MPKMGWIVVVVVLALTSDALAQVDTAWVRTYDGPSQLNDAASRIIVDDDGSVYVAGTSGGPSTRTDILLLKYDSLGTLVWERRFIGRYEDAPEFLTLGESGEIYILGRTAKFNDWDLVLLKYLPDGSLAWMREYDGPNLPSDEVPAGLSIGKEGDLYVGAEFRVGYPGQVGMMVLKYTYQGQLLWEYRYDPPDTGYELAGGMCLDSNDNVYYSSHGYVNQSDYFQRMLVHSISSGGIVRWSFQTVASGEVLAARSGLAFDGDGSIFALGYDQDLPDSSGSLLFRLDVDGTFNWVRRSLRVGGYFSMKTTLAILDGGFIAIGGIQDADYCAVLYDTVGTTQWSRVYGNNIEWDEARSIRSDDFADIYLTGEVLGSSGHYEIVTVSYSLAGDLLWQHSIRGPGESDAFAGELWVSEDGQPYVAGHANGDIVIARLRQSKSAATDILPGSCPNIISTGAADIDYHGIRPGAAAANRPTVPVAILGTKAFDVSRVDPSTIEIAELSPLSHRLVDVSRPLEAREGECECTTAGADGYTDLVLYFDQAQFVAALGPVNDGEVRTLELTGKTKTGVPLSGSDCVTIKEGPIRVSPWASAGEKPETGFAAYPNPFNAATVVSFSLATESDVRLDVYDVLGRRVATLVDDMMPAGEHQVSWDAISAPSGVYFARLATSAGMMTRKMVLVR